MISMLLVAALLSQADGTAVRKRDLVGGSSSLLPSSSKTTTAAADTTLTGPSDLSVDGSVYTLAQMRALSPKLISNAYGTKVYE